jgi:hypothetical protein
VKTTTKWRRVRPGLYHGYDVTESTVEFVALVERGAETARWWWEAAGHCGWTTSLRAAREQAEVWL